MHRLNHPTPTLVNHSITRIPTFAFNVHINKPYQTKNTILDNIYSHPHKFSTHNNSNNPRLPSRIVYDNHRSNNFSLILRHEKTTDDDPFDFSDDEGAGVNEGNRFIPVDDAEIEPEMLMNLEEGKPSELLIMKDLLGINIFTYILAGLIALFFSLNLILGPGWLGQQMGMPGTGTFTEISDSLPDSVDLSGVENLL